MQIIQRRRRLIRSLVATFVVIALAVFLPAASAPADAAALAGIVAISSAPDGEGYLIVAADGTADTYGSLARNGDMSDTRLNQPIVSMAAAPSGLGYWLAAADGGIFTFGGAGYFGSTGGVVLARSIVAMSPTPSGNGYRLFAQDGGDGHWFVTSGGQVQQSGLAPRLGAPVPGSPTTIPPAPIPLVTDADVRLEVWQNFTQPMAVRTRPRIRRPHHRRRCQRAHRDVLGAGPPGIRLLG